LALRVSQGAESIYFTEGLFFSKTAVVSFGGAYAVLAYVAQQAVEVFGWLRPGEMLDGLGMAETTPGPLIQVVQFVGFMGAYRNPGALDPMLAGVFGSIVTTWVTFVPCFLWIFLGAPYIEYLRGNKALTTALSGITAAVVGVILNLAVWFSLQTIFKTVDEVNLGALRLLVPVWGTVDWASLLIAAGAFIAMFKYQQSMLRVLAGRALAGLFYYLTFLG
jgi:chromate transporter